VVASGIVVPGQEARLAFALGGKVETVEVAVGDQVRAGQLLARLAGSEGLTAAIETANLEQMIAQQALDALYKDMDVRQAQAWETYLEARQAYTDTLQARNNLNSLADSPLAKAARQELENAQGLVRRLRAYYNKLPGDPDTDPDKAKAFFNLKVARMRAELAQRKVDEFGGEPRPDELEEAEADLALAQAAMAKSRRDYEILQDGPDPDQVELAEARLSTARAQVAAAQSALADLELLAPFDGTVSALHIHAGEWANPGQPALLLSDLQDLRVETTDLSELDVPKIETGQPVTVIVKALNQEVAGRVFDISPLADTLGGDVVYKTTVELEQVPPGLRAGMSVEVQFRE
jgi:multidrug efflux pump subunit AcrA (membrane-fusion protein)